MLEILPEFIRVLLIEDSDVDAQIVLRTLSGNPHVRCQVGHVSSLGDALSQLCEKEFDVCVLDLGLPDGSMLDSIQQIRTLDGRIPIVVVTGVHDEDIALRAIKHGAQDLVDKHRLVKQDLILTIRMAIARQLKSLGPHARAAIDPMTSLPNARELRSQFDQMRTACQKRSIPMSLALVDITGIGAINKEHGFLIGDAVIQEISSDLSQSLEDDMWMARFGGQEFVVLMPGKTLCEASEAIDQRVQQIASKLITFPDNTNLRVSVDTATVEANDDEWEEVFENAMRKLAIAKQPNEMSLNETQMIIE